MADERTAHLTTLRTGDGSLTLHHANFDTTYHSVHGAVQESTHVFIKAGLEHVGRPHVDVLEVGLGTGLNLLLTWVRCLEGKCTVRYSALETHPLTADQLDVLAHSEDLAWPGLHGPFVERMTAPSGEWQEPMGGLTFRALHHPVQELRAENAYDLVYFDAFAPRSQPELWTEVVMAIMYRALRPGGVLVTYCAKGEVRRAMERVGFAVERLKGPPGKQEMMRATKG
jgi:tRNA U34 5-methylaminomethyl-2-thiouridine-forming methyltransferase MnmC